MNTDLLATEARQSFGPYFVSQFDPQSAVLAGKWCVESDISNRVTVLATREEAVKCAQRRYKAWLRRRHP